MEGITERQRFHHLPGLEVRDANVAHFPCSHQVIEDAQCFFQGSQRIPGVQVIHVNVVSLQPAQTGIDGVQNVIARQSAVVWPRLGRKMHFGSQDDLVTFALDGLPNDFFRASTSIDISRIEKIAARVEKAGNDAFGFSRWSTPLTLFSKNHGSQAQGRYNQATTAKLFIVHQFCAPFPSSL